MNFKKFATLDENYMKIRLLGRNRKLCSSEGKFEGIRTLQKILWDVTRQIVFKIYGKDCYTCKAKDLVGVNCQCGHFITDATCDMQISHDLRNLRPQCFHCNINLSGNWAEFERRLIADEGKKYVEDLKAENFARKGKHSYREDWYAEQIIHRYKWLEKHAPELVV